ncbi:MAG: hypothetical protein AAFW66_13990 [Pseudomonadota bacterium]
MKIVYIMIFAVSVFVPVFFGTAFILGLLETQKNGSAPHNRGGNRAITSEITEENLMRIKSRANRMTPAEEREAMKAMQNLGNHLQHVQ